MLTAIAVDFQRRLTMALSRRQESLEAQRSACGKGRPVGVAIDKTGALLIADEVGNSVWRATAAGR